MENMDFLQPGGVIKDVPLRKQLFVEHLKAKDVIQSSFLVKSKDVPLSKNGKPYLLLNLMDRTGEIDSRMWEGVEEASELFSEGDVIAISGRVNQFQGRLQLIVQHLAPVESREVDLSYYLPVSGEDIESLYEDLLQVFRSLKNPWIKELALSLLEDPEIAKRYKVCPAAKTIHHAFLGGLLCHSLQLCRLVESIFPLYEDLDKDLLLFGAAFHDFGKIYELTYHGGFGYSDEGKLVGHIAIAISLMDRKIQAINGFPAELEWQLKHLVLSHHGKLEFGSPKRPHTIEAQVLHHLDDMDSKINSIQTFMKNTRGLSRWTAHHKAYDQYYYRPDAYLNPPEF